MFKFFKNVAFYLLIVIAAIWAMDHYSAGNTAKTDISYTAFMKHVQQDEVRSVTISENSITVSRGGLTGIPVDAGNIPDLIPIISVAAAAADSGVTVISNAERLRLKESDRLAAISECLNNIGNVNAETDDGIVVWSGEKIAGGNVFSFYDHRIVMSMAIASTASSGDIVIRDAEAVNKSYPTFFDDFKALGGICDVIDTQGE